MKKLLTSPTLTTGFATFAMFFGAGNVVFPLGIGQFAQDKNIFAILGLLITSVGVPLTGLITMILFNGEYKKFFERIGDIPGYLLALFLMVIIGPFGATPRTVALSYSTVNVFYPIMSLPLFSIIFCTLIFIFAYRRSSIIDILGKYLTPFLLLALFTIIIRGLFTIPEVTPQNSENGFALFFHGLSVGYQTMDLLATPFFSSVIIVGLKSHIDPKEQKNYRVIIFQALKASCIAASLLAFIYVGFSYVAAFHSAELEFVKQEDMIGTVALHMLGTYGGIVASCAVALACLTTAIALASVFAEYIHKDISGNKISYGAALAFTMVITFFMSTLEFSGIVQALTPILIICYPALIVLCVVNMFYKLQHFKPVKGPFYAVLLLSLLLYFI